VLVVGKTPATKLANDVIEIMTDREKLEGENLRNFHSCPKPVALYQHLLEALTKRGQAIYEPFSGSGTTLVACERSRRKCRAVEISPAYVDVAILRWQQVTGQDAIRQATGETFNAMRAARG
jgi:DNA modification methylase